MAANLDAEVAQGGTATPPSPKLPEPTKTDPSDTTTRMWISYGLLIVMTAVIIAAFGDLFYINYTPFEPNAASAAKDAADDADRLMKMMNVVFGPVVTLVSSVVGFYFGARTAKESGSG